MAIINIAGLQSRLRIAILTIASLVMVCLPWSGAMYAQDDITQGALRVKTADGGIVECPLKHTDVKAEISGYITRVNVTQIFTNPYNRSIEAVYVFPLSHTGAVDKMTMTVGGRRIVGVMKKREEAKRIYDAAIAAGKTASLLEQERPNIFTQTVGNIAPGEEVKIDISYVDALGYDNGVYEFHFPMVVGPRYIPGAPLDSLSSTAGPGVADTDRVPDASRITPRVLKPGTRTGHDVSLSVTLNAGVPVHALNAVNHVADIARFGKSAAKVVLSPYDNIPNKDFVLKYEVAGDKPEVAVLSYSKGKDGYFMLMVQPTLTDVLAKAPPREIVFLVDVSGSMAGQPTTKMKAAMKEFLNRLNKNDTFQVIVFYSNAEKMFTNSVKATDANVKKALSFTADYEPGGGTEMMKGIEMALEEPSDPTRVRIVVMLTDGFIGNEAEIIKKVSEKSGDQVRFWTLGIGSSSNRYLIDGVANAGHGGSAILEPLTNPGPLVATIMDKIHRAQLAHIDIDWSGLTVYDTYPERIPELWAGRPVILFGRYNEGASTTVKLSGTVEGKRIEFPVNVSLTSGDNSSHDVLPSMWARKKIDDLTEKMNTTGDRKLADQITDLALRYNIMTSYTSFVAVDESRVNTAGDAPIIHVDVPVPLPDEVEYQGIYGDEGWPEVELMAVGHTAAMPPPLPAPVPSKNGGTLFRTLSAIKSQVQGGDSTAAPATPGGKAAEEKASVVTPDKERDKNEVEAVYIDSPISVKAPAKASAVAVAYDDKTSSNLAFDVKQGLWTGRLTKGFTLTADSHKATITVTLQDGRKVSFKIKLEVSHPLTPATAVVGAGGLIARVGDSIAISLEGVDVTDVAVAVPWSANQTFKRSSKHTWEAMLMVPTLQQVGATTLNLTVTDSSKNAIALEIGLTVK